MKSLNSFSLAPERLQNIFNNTFQALDIASPVLYLDSSFSKKEIKEKLIASTASVGILAESSDQFFDLKTETSSELKASAIVDDDYSIHEIILLLKDEPVLFIKQLNSIAGSIRIDDLERPAMRMWLFGVISLMEMNLKYALRALFTDDELVELISPGRLKKAEALCEERKRRKYNCDFVDCLQLSDLMQIFFKSDKTYPHLAIKSKKEARRLTADIESLRNHLSHSESIQDNWDVICKIAENFESIILAKRIKEIMKLYGVN